MPLIQLRGEPCQLEKPEMENIGAVPGQLLHFKAEGLPLCVIRWNSSTQE